MANSNSARVIKLTVMVNGQRQVLNTLEDYQTHIKRLAVHMNDLDKQIKNAGNNPALLNRLKAERKALADEIKDMKAYVKELRQAQTDINNLYAKSKSKQSLADVKSDNRNAKQVASRLDPGNKSQAKDLERISKIIGEQNYKIKEQEKAMKAVVMPAKELGKVLGNLDKAPLDQLKNAEAELVRQLSQATRGTEEFARTNSRLQAVRQQIQQTGESMKGVAMTTTQLNNTMRNLSTAPMQKLKTAEDQLKKSIADGNLTEKQRERTLKNLSSVQREITKREQEAAAAVKKGAQSAKDATIGYKNYQTVLKDQKATMEQLKRAAQELKEKMEKTAPNTREYKTYAEQLQKVNARIKEGTDQHTKHASAISQAMSRLKTYVMIYMGFNKLLDVLRNFKTAVLSLSDSIADIQKVTKMSAEDVDRLSLAINRIDTRSSIEQLHKLGYQAGLLGLTSQQDILGFVRAADQMNWALKELGEDGAVNLMKVANLTHETEKYGVEGALKKIGSAINEITANSAASAGPVTEIVSRLGAVGSVAGYASAELVAIGSTMNALGVKSEMGATAVNKIMIALNNNLPSIALHSGLVADELKKLKDDTDALYAKGESNMTGAMAVMMTVLQKLHETSEASGNTLATLQPIFKDMGKEGTRLATTLTNLVDNVDTLGEHLDITSSAFDEGVSMLNEYNVKNETAAALLARLGNRLQEVFVNSTVTRGLQRILKAITDLSYGTGSLVTAFKALVSITAVYASTQLVSVLTSIANGVKGVVAAIIAEKTAMVENMTFKWLSIAASGAHAVISEEEAVALIGETTAWNALTLAMKANPIGALLSLIPLLITAIVALGGVIWTLTGNTKAANDMQEAVSKSTSEVISQFAEEKAETERLFKSLELLVDQQNKEKESVDKVKGSIDKHNLSADEARKKTDELEKATKKLEGTEKEINKVKGQILAKYPDTISYLNKERILADDVKNAYEGVNVALQRKLQLSIKEAQMEAAKKTLQDALSSSAENSDRDFRDIARHAGLDEMQTATYVGNMKAMLAVLVSSGKDVNTVYKEIMKTSDDLIASFGKAEPSYYGKNLKEIKEQAIIPAIKTTEAYIKMMDQIEKIEKDNTDKLNKENATTTGMRQLNAEYKQMKDSYAKFEKADAESKVKLAQQGLDAYRKMQEDESNYYQYLTAEQKKNYDKMKSQAESWSKAMIKYTEDAHAVENGAAGNFGGKKIGSWADWDDQELVDKWKQLTTDMNNVRAGSKEIAARFGKEFGQQLSETSDGLEKARKMYHDRIKEVYKELQARDLTAQGVVNYKDPKGSKKHYIWVNGVPMTESDIKQELDAGKAALEAYYQDQEDQARKAYLDGSLGSEQDLQNELNRINLRKEYSFKQFYEKLLHISNDFKEKAYGDFMKVRDIYGDLTDQYKDLDTLRLFLNQMGSGMQDGLVKGLATASNNIQKIQVQHMNALHKIMLQYDYEGTVNEQYKAKLSEAELFWSNIEEVNAEGSRTDAESRIQLFKALANDIVGMDADMLRERMENDAAFAEWNKDRTQRDYDALLVLLRDYHDNLIEAEKKHATRQKKIVDQEWDARIIAQDKAKKIQDVNAKMLRGLASDGYVDNSTVTRYEIAHLKQRKAYQEEYLAELKARGAATKEAEAALMALMESLEEKQNELRKQMRDTVMEYAGMFTEMMNTMATASNEHASLTALAEIAAKRRLGIAVDETKKEYMIYSRSGKAIRKMMTDEEKLRWDMQNDARNQQLDALAKWLDDWGKKLSNDITQAFSSRLALENQKEQEEKELKQYGLTVDKKLATERILTEGRGAELSSQLEAVRDEQAEEVRIYQQAADKKKSLMGSISSSSAPSNDNLSKMQYNDLDDYINSIASADNFDEEEYARVFGYWSQRTNAGEDRTYGNIGDGLNLKEVFVTSNKEMLTDTTSTHKAMTESHKSMVQAMVQGMNMYGIAYNAVMNDSLSVSQRVGLATLQSFGQIATSMLSAVLSEAIASMTIENGKAIAKIWGKTINPAVALPLIAVVTGAIGAAMAAGTKAITKSKQEISAVTGAASGKKVAAGMLTYAEGNYPVLGSDGEVYDAKRETSWKTKVYSSPHYGILGEKGPELIVDGVTTRKMMTLRPDLYQDILDLAHGRQMVRARAYADGNYPAMPAVNGGGGAADDTNAMLVAAISQLNAQLATGITIDALGERGAVKQMQTASDWMQKHGLL